MSFEIPPDQPREDDEARFGGDAAEFLNYVDCFAAALRVNDSPGAQHANEGESQDQTYDETASFGDIMNDDSLLQERAGLPAENDDQIASNMLRWKARSAKAVMAAYNEIHGLRLAFPEEAKELDRAFMDSADTNDDVNLTPDARAAMVMLAEEQKVMPPIISFDEDE